MKKNVLFIFLLGLLILSSCSPQKKSSIGGSNSDTITQIELNQEEDVDATNTNDGARKQIFRLEHPFLFTLIIIFSLALFVLLVYIITTKISETIIGTVGTGIGNAIGDVIVIAGEKIADFFRGFRK